METGCRYKGLLHRQWSFSFHPCCFTRRLPNFPSFHPPLPSFYSVSSIPVQLLHAGSLFSFNLTFLPLSFIRLTPLSRCHISVSASPFIIISTCHIILFIPLFRSSTHLPECPFIPPSPLSLFRPSVLFICSVCSLDTSTQKYLQALNTALN